MQHARHVNIEVFVKCWYIFVLLNLPVHLLPCNVFAVLGVLFLPCAPDVALKVETLGDELSNLAPTQEVPTASASGFSVTK